MGYPLFSLIQIPEFLNIIGAFLYISSSFYCAWCHFCTRSMYCLKPPRRTLVVPMGSYHAQLRRQRC